MNCISPGCVLGALRVAGGAFCAFGVAAALGVLPAAPVAAETDEPSMPVRSSIVLDIETPIDGSVVGDPGGLAFVSGKALASYGEFERFDIAFVIDQSESTSSPSGGDVNGDGVIEDGCGGASKMLGFLTEMVGACGNSPDSILSAELAAARTLLRQLDPRSTQVSVVTFSGDGRSGTPDAAVVSPLTSDFRSIEAALDRIDAMGPRGSTNMEAGIRVAALELIGAQAVFSNVLDRPQQIILFLSDGLPTLPAQQSIRRNRRAALESALTAGRFDIRVDTYGIGDEALSQPVTLVDMARVTRGIFTPVSSPRDLTLIFQDLDFSQVEELEIRNLTADKPAAYMVRNADGTFGALLEMEEGVNVVEIFARAGDGSQERRQLAVQFVKDASAPPLPTPLVAQRNRLLETRLLDLRSRPSPRDEEMRRALKLRIQEERRRIQERTRGLTIEADGLEGDDPIEDDEAEQPDRDPGARSEAEPE